MPDLMRGDFWEDAGDNPQMWGRHVLLALQEKRNFEKKLPWCYTLVTFFTVQQGKKENLMNALQQYLQSSIGKKQIVAVTGLMLIGFILGHLAGNFFIFKGPEALNAYAQKLASMRPALLLVEMGLLGIFLLHVTLTLMLLLYNNDARPIGYDYYQPTDRSIATKLMPYTGTLLIVFVLWHLVDFTFSDKTGTLSVLGKESLGLYGVVFNAFLNPIHSGFYILAMCAIGFHLSHGFQSFVQTLGLNHPKYTPGLQMISIFLGAGVAILYSSIPLFVMFFAKIPQ